MAMLGYCADMAVRRALSGTRLKLLRVLSGSTELTAAEIAAACGLPPSQITGMLHRMHADGLLSASSDPGPPSRGARFSRTQLGEELLSAALAAERPIGRLDVGRWTVTVQFSSAQGQTLALQHLMQDPVQSGVVDWIAVLGQDHLVVLREETAYVDAVGLTTMLEALGCTCRLGQVGVLIAGGDLGQQARRHVVT